MLGGLTIYPAVAN